MLLYCVSHVSQLITVFFHKGLLSIVIRNVRNAANLAFFKCVYISQVCEQTMQQRVTPKKNI